MSKNEDEERRRRHSEYVTEVFRAMLADASVKTARNKMKTTKIRTGPDADKPHPKVPDGRLPPHLRQNPSPAKAAPPPPPPPKPAKSNVVELRPTPKKTDMAEVFRKSDFWLKLLGQKIRGDWTGFEIHAPPGSAERTELYREVNEEYRRITGEDY